MAPLTSTRLAWSVTLASLSLWALSAPITWGQAAVDTTTRSDETTVVTTAPGGAVLSATDGDQPPACPPAAIIPPAIAALIPPVSTSSNSSSSGTNPNGTFRVCQGTDLTATARAIEQLIAGHGFSASLSSLGDGCADLTIRATSGSTGSSTSRLNVSVDSGQNLMIEIKSENGSTHVNIGQSR